jgi:hypothetical protein
VEILKANKTLQTLVLSSEDNAQFQFHLFVCQEIQTLIFFLFLFLVAESQFDDKGRELINEAAALNGSVRIEWGD